MFAVCVVDFPDNPGMLAYIDLRQGRNSAGMHCRPKNASWFDWILSPAYAPRDIQDASIMARQLH